MQGPGEINKKPRRVRGYNGRGRPQALDDTIRGKDQYGNPVAVGRSILRKPLEPQTESSSVETSEIPRERKDIPSSLEKNQKSTDNGLGTGQIVQPSSEENTEGSPDDSASTTFQYADPPEFPPPAPMPYSNDEPAEAPARIPSPTRYPFLFSNPLLSAATEKEDAPAVEMAARPL